VENEWDIDQMIPDLKLFRTVHSSLFTDQVNDLILKLPKQLRTHLQAKQIEHVLISQLNFLENQY
jgi:hypothetical protein